MDFQNANSRFQRRSPVMDHSQSDPRAFKQNHTQRFSNCHYCGQMFNSKQFLIQHLNETCVERKRRHPNAPPVRDNRHTGNLANQATRFVPTHPLPPDMNMEPSRMQQWKYLSGRATADLVANLFFAGAIDKKSLTGGCGWWVVNENTVVAYGSAPVLQNYSSLIRLEYEGLLNGLQAAIRKGIRKLKIKSSSALIISHLTDGHGIVSSMKSILYTVQDLHSAILKALKQFQYTEFNLIHSDENAYPIKLAHKAIADHTQPTEEVIDKKMKAAFISIDKSSVVTTTNTTTTIARDGFMKTLSPKSVGSTDTDITANTDELDYSNDMTEINKEFNHYFSTNTKHQGETKRFSHHFLPNDVNQYSTNICLSTNFINSFM